MNGHRWRLEKASSLLFRERGRVSLNAFRTVLKKSTLTMYRCTGCLTCRKGKVKCDEEKPTCQRCRRLQFECIWAEQPTPHFQGFAHRPREGRIELANNSATVPSYGPTIQPFVVEFPNADRASLPYLNHFITFCSRFLAYTNDGQGNPFQQELVPLAASSPALLHSMVALAAGHMARGEPRHALPAVKHYSIALRELNLALSDPAQLSSNSTLGACLMLCVYEVGTTSEDRDSLTNTFIDIPFRQKSLVAASSRSPRSHHVSRGSTNIRLSFPIFLITGHIWILVIW